MTHRCNELAKGLELDDNGMDHIEGSSKQILRTEFEKKKETR